VPVFRRATYFFGAQWRQRLSWTDAPGAKEIFKTLTREQVIPADGLVSRIGYPHPRFSRDENDRVWTCHGSLVANGYRCTAIFKDDHLFGVVMFVERNHGAGIQNFVSDVKVLGISVQFVDLDDESGNGT